jgi:hypothetical protein
MGFSNLFFLSTYQQGFKKSRSDINKLLTLGGLDPALTGKIKNDSLPRKFYLTKIDRKLTKYVP